MPLPLSRWDDDKIRSAVEHLESTRQRAHDLAVQLGDVKRQYNEAVAALDVETAASLWPKVQVLEAVARAAAEQVYQPTLDDVRAAFSRAESDILVLRSEILRRAPGPSAFVDRNLSRALETGRHADVGEAAQSVVQHFVIWHNRWRAVAGEAEGIARRLSLLDHKPGEGVDPYLLERAERVMRDLEALRQDLDVLLNEIRELNTKYFDLRFLSGAGA